MKRSANQSLKCGNDGEKSKSQREILTNADHTNRGKPTYKKQAFAILSSNLFQAFKREEQFTPLRLPINESSIPSRTSRGLKARGQSNMTLYTLERKITLLIMTMRHQTIHCRILRKYLEELIRQGFLKEYVLTLRAAFNAG